MSLSRHTKQEFRRDSQELSHQPSTLHNSIFIIPRHQLHFIASKNKGPSNALLIFDFMEDDAISGYYPVYLIYE